MGGPGGYKALQWVQGPGLPNALKWTHRIQEILESGASDEDMSAALSDETGTLINVATFNDPFVLRKLQVRWSRDGGMAGGTDDAVTTHHFVKLAGGVPVDTWDATNFTAVESAFTTFWAAIKGNYTAKTSLKQFRWYKDGPDIVPPQPPVRIVDINSPGTVSGTNGQEAPQVAISVTEKTADATAWGRFYLPAPVDTIATMYGRIGTTFQTAIADAADVMYENWVTNGCPGVVYSKEKPERETGSGETLPARPARALTVMQVQVDDLFDVIRSRRWKQPLLRLQRDIAGA